MFRRSLRPDEFLPIGSFRWTGKGAGEVRASPLERTRLDMPGVGRQKFLAEP